MLIISSIKSKNPHFLNNLSLKIQSFKSCDLNNLMNWLEDMIRQYLFIHNVYKKIKLLSNSYFYLLIIVV